MTFPSPPGAARSTSLPCQPMKTAYSVQVPSGAVQSSVPSAETRDVKSRTVPAAEYATSAASGSAFG
jgi:hypothetical protein